MNIYCISDIHGHLLAFNYALSLVEEHLAEENTKLVLLGDYIHGPNSYEVLDRIISLQTKWGKAKVIALRGNHEDMACSGTWPIGESRIKSENSNQAKDGRYLAWMKSLPFYYCEGNVIFVHAGIDEELKEMWKWTDEHTFMWKYPAQTGTFFENLKIVAGHISTATIVGDPTFHDIVFDGKSHYFIDGTVQESGTLPILLTNTDTETFYHITENGKLPIFPYT